MTKYKYFLLFFSFISIFISEVLHAKSISLKQALEMPAEDRLELVQLVKNSFISNFTECSEALSRNSNITETTVDNIGEDIIAFMMTLHQDNPEMFDLLLKAIKEANLNVQDEKQDTLLHYTASVNNVGMVKALIVAEADINARNNSGYRPLHIAAAYGGVEVVMALIEVKVDMSVDDLNQLLYIAVRYNNLEVVEALIAAGVNVNRKDRDTLLHEVAWAEDSSTEVAIVLIRAGAYVNIQTPKGNTPLHYAAMNNNVELIRILIVEGANLDVQNNAHQNNYFINKNTPLHIAILEGRVEATKELIEAGADLDIQNAEGKTPRQLMLEKEQQATE